MTRRLLIPVGVSLLLACASLQTAIAQDMNGDFTSQRSGETFRIDGNSDGTAEIYGSDGRHVGTAQDNGDGTWDITSPDGRPLGQIQDNGDGSIDVTGANGGMWGSGSQD